LASACEPAANPYPENTRADFMALCRMGAEPCDCAWDKITKAMTHDDYQNALKTLETRGTMDPRIVSASLACRP
jgi:hypothetical protein